MVATPPTVVTIEIPADFEGEATFAAFLPNKQDTQPEPQAEARSEQAEGEG